ncbi:MAG: glycosyltransferase family 4 protein [Acidobacteria bacterium]|nr:glycosyltransferase family 4 protein [Acidobacteriota bacterium]
MLAVRLPVRIAYLVSHPIQYQVPLLRRIAQEPDIDLTVFYGSDFSVRGYKDDGFGVDLKWDLPLLGGYKHEFLPVLRDIGTQTVTAPLNRGFLRRLKGRNGEPPFDLLWVHGYAMVNSMAAMLAAKALGIPVLMRSDSTMIDRSRSEMKLAAKRLFFLGLRQLIDGVLTVGTLNDAYWQHAVGDSVPRFLMPYAVDNAYFQSRSEEAAPRRAELMAEWGIEPGRPVILFASKLQQRKHADHLLEAYRLLLARTGKRPYLLIVGDGETREMLEREAEGLADVRFCGFRNQSELPRYFDLATVFVLPARHEPWGLIVNEAMNAQRPVIVSSDVGAHPDLVTDGVEGYVYPVGDIEALATALHRVIDTPGEAERMGRAAFERINEWDFERDIAALRRAIAKLTGKISSPEE